jgi:hypothetical protein
LNNGRFPNILFSVQRIEYQVYELKISFGSVYKLQIDKGSNALDYQGKMHCPDKKLQQHLIE